MSESIISSGGNGPAIPNPSSITSILSEDGVAIKISNMTVLPNPPTVAGAFVPVVQPGDTTNYQSPISTLLTTAAGETIYITAGSSNSLGLEAGNVVFAGGDDTTVSNGNGGGSFFFNAGNSNGGGGGQWSAYAGTDNSNGLGGTFLTGAGNSNTGDAGDWTAYGGTSNLNGRPGDIYFYGGTSSGGGGGNINLIVGTDDVNNVTGNILLYTNGESQIGEIVINSDASFMDETYRWRAGNTINGDIVYTATRAERITAIIARIKTANGSAATMAPYKAPNGTAFSAGTALTTNSVDLNGAVNYTQTLDLSATMTDIILAPGDSVGLVTSGTMTLAEGSITIHRTPQ